MDGMRGPTKEAMEAIYGQSGSGIDGPPEPGVVYNLLVGYGLPGLAFEHPGVVEVYPKTGGIISRGSGCRWHVVYGEYIGLYAPNGREAGDDPLETVDVPDGEGADWVAREIIRLVEDFPA